MRLGIDFGTSRTVVAAVIKGNTPIVTFEDDSGDAHEWIPTMAAGRGSEIRYGWNAFSKLGEPGWTVVRSLKRLLADHAPHAEIELGSYGPVSLIDLVTGFFRALKRAIQKRSNCPLRPGEKLRAMFAVPANAGSNQRYITLEGLRGAGFEVLGMFNEPSAAGIEYAHRYMRQVGPRSAKEWVVIYDLGGGTFDTSVVGVAKRRHDVVSSEGIARLGGDDFDRALLELVMQTRGTDPATLDPRAEVALLEECRQRKEGLNPNTRRLIIEDEPGGAEDVVVPTAELYARCRPLIEETLAAVDRAMKTIPGERDGRGRLESLKALAAIYLVGGSSVFPAVARAVRERFPRRVRRSPYPHAATAIGLAVAANAENEYVVQEAITRHFGVWREGESGERITFDPIFRKDERAQAPNGMGMVESVRRYRPVHNVGHFRFVECTRLTPQGEPAGDLIPWKEIRFAYDPDLRGKRGLAKIPVERHRGLNLVEEIYTYDEFGVIEVQFVDRAAGYSQRYRLSR